MKHRSRVHTGFHRLGVVISTPLLVGAAVLAILQWQYPTGPMVTELPQGTEAFSFGDYVDDAAKQIIEEQRRAGFEFPYSGVMIVGLPLGTTRRDNIDWTRWQLPDAREIGIAGDSKKAGDVARDFLLTEKRNRRLFTDKDEPMSIKGVAVTFLNFLDQDPLAAPPWQHRQHEWVWALLALGLGSATYIVLRAIGWVTDGFANSRPTE